MMPSGGCAVMALIFQAWIDGSIPTFEPPRIPIPYDMTPEVYNLAANLYAVDPNTIRYFGVGPRAGHVGVALTEHLH